MVFNEGFILQSSSVTVCGSNERLLSFKEICWHFFSTLKKCQESAIVQITLPREGFIDEQRVISEDLYSFIPDLKMKHFRLCI